MNASPLHQTIDQGADHASPAGGRRLRRQAAHFAARCAMASWLVLAAMPVAVLVFALG